jgi:hypothetical protein
MKSPLTNFRFPHDLEREFEAKIRTVNDNAGRGQVLLHGDRTRYILDAIRAWIKED